MLLYTFRRQKYILLEYCIIHNFIKIEMQDDILFRQYGEENIELEVEDLNENNLMKQYVLSLICITNTLQMTNL